MLPSVHLIVIFSSCLARVSESPDWGPSTSKHLMDGILAMTLSSPPAILDVGIKSPDYPGTLESLAIGMASIEGSAVRRSRLFPNSNSPSPLSTADIASRLRRTGPDGQWKTVAESISDGRNTNHRVRGKRGCINVTSSRGKLRQAQIECAVTSLASAWRT